MKKITKKFTYHTMILGVAGLIAIASYSSCDKGKDKEHKPSDNSANQTKPPPSPSVNDYDQNDVKKMKDFFGQFSQTPGKTNRDIIEGVDFRFDVSKPWTWDDYCVFDPYTKRLASFTAKSSASLSGILDLTGCNEIITIDVSNSNITLVKIPKNSFAGRFGWFVENASEQEVQKLIDLKESQIYDYIKAKSKPIPNGPVTLTNIYSNSFDSFLQAHLKPHPFKNSSGGNITVTLVD